jgi:hypothetical protein
VGAVRLVFLVMGIGLSATPLYGQRQYMSKVNKIIMAIVFLSSFISAQDTVRKNPFWLNFSVGGSPEFLNINSSFNKVLDNFSYQISLNAGSNDVGIHSNYGMTTGNVGLGLVHYKESIFSAIYFGPSISYGEGKEYSKNEVNFWGVGFGLNVQVYFMPLYKIFPDIGLGVELFYNLNVFQTKDVDYWNVYSIRIGACITNIHIY